MRYDGAIITPSRLDPDFIRRMDGVGIDLSAENTDETVFFLSGGLPVDGGAVLFGRTEREGDRRGRRDAPESGYALTDRSRLKMRAVPGTFSTDKVVVDAVLPSDKAPTLTLTEADICRISGADGLYDTMQVSVDPLLPVSQLMEILTLTYKATRGTTRSGCGFWWIVSVCPID